MKGDRLLELVCWARDTLARLVQTGVTREHRDVWLYYQCLAHAAIAAEGGQCWSLQVLRACRRAVEEMPADVKDRILRTPFPVWYQPKLPEALDGLSTDTADPRQLRPGVLDGPPRAPGGAPAGGAGVGTAAKGNAASRLEAPGGSGSQQSGAHRRGDVMVDARKFGGGNYLRQEDVPEPRLVTIAKVDQAVFEDSGKEREKLVVDFEELGRRLVVNSINNRRLQRACGHHETDNWTGKQVVIFVDPDVEMGGRVVGGLRVRKPSQKETEANEAAPF